MDNLKEKLKNLDYKQFAVDHAEKAVFGIVCLFVLICLGGTSWSRYEKEPEEFLNKVRSESSNLDSSGWPQEKRADYDAAKDIKLSVEQLRTKFDVTPYLYNTPYIHPLHPQHEKIKQPDVYAPEKMMAKTSEAILKFRNENESEDANFGVELAKTEPKDTKDNPADPNFPLATAPRRGGGANNSRQGGGDAGANTEGAEVFQDKGATADAADIGNLGGGDETGMGAKVDDERINAEGRRFASIVGLIPLRKYSHSFAKALNIDSPAAAAERVEFVEFELERQIATADDDPWTGKWELVDVEIAIEILKKIEDHDPEVVSSALTDPVFTMPLPKRVAGEWGPWATHPDLNLLSEEQREQQMLVDEKALKAAQEKQLASASKKPQKKGGFVAFRHDIRSARRGVGAQQMQSIASDAMQQMGADGMGQAQGRRGANNSGLHAIIAGQVLLFRYLDFDVEAGNAYRYRLRLVLRNPNWNQPIEDLVDPEIAKAELLKTEWSEPTNPVVIREYQAYFLTKVNRSRSQTSAEINVLKWYQEAGTLIQAELNKILPGQFIAAFKGNDRDPGGVETYVLRPANETLKKENIELVTKDVLLDIDGIDAVTAEEHADLGINFKKRGEASVADQVLVVDQFGRLKTLDSTTGQFGTKGSAMRIKQQNVPWLPIVKKNQAARAPKGALDQMADDIQRNPDGSGSRKSASSKKRRRSSRNPLRKTPRRK